MSFTRFHDDPSRIIKHNEESTFTGRYMLNAPGPGINLPFMEDPQIRMQKWGANLQSNTVNMESDLRGITRKYNRDLVDKNVHTPLTKLPYTQSYRNENPFIEESRSSHPAWMYKDLEQSRWEMPFLNPQANLEVQFDRNIDTRVLEKDSFIPKIPNVGRDVHYLPNHQFSITGNAGTPI
jgi:hypothetical protein